jgi:hypothetical protein
MEEAILGELLCGAVDQELSAHHQDLPRYP